MCCTRFLGLALSVICLLAAACGSTTAGGSGGSSGTGGSTTGTGGSTSGTGGATTGTGGSTSGTGGSSGGFMAVAPCATEAAYTTTGTTVMFGAAAAGYMPKCLKVSAGALVTFMGGTGANDNFTMHPLEASSARGTTAGNPIATTSSGTSKSFTFAAPGYYAYYCTIHGNDTSGGGWSGVVWVQ